MTMAPGRMTHADKTVDRCFRRGVRARGAVGVPATRDKDWSLADFVEYEPEIALPSVSGWVVECWMVHGSMEGQGGLSTRGR